MLKTRQSREFWLLAVVALLVLGAGLGLRDPWPADEPRFVLVAKQMWESGDWWFPHRGQELYPDKPPLYFWLLGASYALRSEEHTSELQSLMRNSYAVFCLKKKKIK